MDQNIVKNNLQSITQSYELFNLRTLFPNTLFIDLSNQTITNDFVSKMEDTKTSEYIFDLLKVVNNSSQGMASSVSNNNRISDFSNKGIFPYIFSGYGTTPSVLNDFINTFQSHALPNASRIDNLTDKTMNVPEDYKNNMKLFFKNMYFNILLYLNKTLTNSQSQSFTIPMSKVMTDTYSDKLLTYIESNVYTYIYSSTNTIDEYIKNLYDGAITNSYGIGKFTTSHFNLFFVVFLPYFYFLYISSILPSANITATNHGIRDGIVRRWAILAFYKFYMYFFYSIYKVTSLYDPNSTLTIQIRQILDINMTSLFDQDTTNAMSTKILDDLNSETKSNMDKFNQLQGKNRKITMNRSNLNNILTLKMQADAELKKAKVIKWVWFTFLIIYLAFVPLVYFIPIFKKNVEYFLMISLIWAIILTIIGMVAVAKNF